MAIIEATDEEILALRQLLHRAVLHSGLDAAEAALHWNRKLIAAMSAPASMANGKDAEHKTGLNG